MKGSIGTSTHIQRLSKNQYRQLMRRQAAATKHARYIKARTDELHNAFLKVQRKREMGPRLVKPVKPTPRPLPTEPTVLDDN